MGVDRGEKDFLLERRERPAVHSKFDEAGAHARLLDAMLELADPAPGKLIDRFRMHVRGHEAAVRGEIVPRDGQHVQPALCG